jgi:hypothetical protein
VESTISCDYDETLGFDIFESYCECESAILIGESATQVCGCGLCEANQTQLVSLDCSISIDDPFVVDDCRGQSCTGECIENENLGNPILGNDTGIPETEAPTLALNPEATSPPSAGVRPSILPSEAPSSIPSTAATLIATEMPSTAAGGETATTEPPSTATPSITTGGQAAPTLAPSTETFTSAPSTPAPLETTLAPTIATTNRTTAPTINNVSTSTPTAGGPTSKPTGWLAWGNITDRPLNNSTEQPVDGIDITEFPTENIAPETKSPKWYTHNMIITFGGAFLCTCFLLCMMVSCKGDMRGALVGEKKQEDYGLNMFTL